MLFLGSQDTRKIGKHENIVTERPPIVHTETAQNIQLKNAKMFPSRSGYFKDTDLHRQNLKAEHKQPQFESGVLRTFENDENKKIFGTLETKLTDLLGLDEFIVKIQFHGRVGSLKTDLITVKVPTCSAQLCTHDQGRRELSEVQGQNRKIRPPASEASRKFFPSRPLNFLKMHFRAFPTVKISKIFNYEALRLCGPEANCPSCPLSAALLTIGLVTRSHIRFIAAGIARLQHDFLAASVHLTLFLRQC